MLLPKLPPLRQPVLLVLRPTQVFYYPNGSYVTPRALLLAPDLIRTHDKEGATVSQDVSAGKIRVGGKGPHHESGVRL